MLDSSEGVCPGQARFEYPATSVLFSNQLGERWLAPLLETLLQGISGLEQSPVAGFLATDLQGAAKN
jgi:hypothetical protein